MVNMIMIWAGEIVDIPAGWALCDGNNGTPDLRNRFVIGAGDTYAVGDSGGSINHTHGFTGDGHVHSIPTQEACPGNAAAVCLDGNETGNQAAAGTTESDGSLPPYHALAYIMKVP